MASSPPVKATADASGRASGRTLLDLSEQPDFFENATRHGLAVNLLLAAVAVVGLWPVTGTAHLIAWATFMVLVLAFRLVLHQGFIGTAGDDTARQHWRALVVASCALIGAAWGWMGYILFPAHDAEHQLLALMILAVAVATTHTLAPLRAAAAAYLLPAVVPIVARLVLLGGSAWGATAAMLCALMCFVWWSLLRYRAEFSDRMRLHMRQQQSDIERATYVRSVETANRLFAQVVFEREQAEADLQVAKKTAEEANRVKGEFLAYTSHEMRTPLNAIIGLTRAVMDSPLTTEQRDYLRRVRNAGDRLLALLNDLLDMSKIEAGKLEIERVDFNLREVLDEVIQEQLVRAAEKGLQLNLDVARDTPDHLVGNAIKFTEKGAVIISVALLERASDAACTLRMSVIDTGIGISPAKQAMLFERYTQAESSTSRKFGGTGLGLSISKSLVELMGGTIGVQSRVGQGTEFFVALPFGLRDRPPGPEDGVARTPDTTVAHVPRILVAEDNEDNQLLIELLLRKKGVDVTIVGSGEEALAQLDVELFDLVLMDLEMPGMGGFDAVAALRAHERGTGRRVPVIALSAHALVGYREKCLAAGMDDYLTKPIDPDTLYAAIDGYACNRAATGVTQAGDGR